jgi:hypothetical protein
MPQTNQYKPIHTSPSYLPCPSIMLSYVYSCTAPDHVIREPLTFYYQLGLGDNKIVEHCRGHYDEEQYGLRYDPILLVFTDERILTS